MSLSANVAGIAAILAVTVLFLVAIWAAFEVVAGPKLAVSGGLETVRAPIATEFRVSALEDTNEAGLRALGLTPHHSVRIDTVSEGSVTKQTVLHGRFLHITDMHPDELNVIGGAIMSKCHKKSKDAKKDEKSHRYGDAMSGCDSPLDLYNSTLQWVRENLKDKIDFVVWTGDNIRHDNDRSHPRLEMEILDMNEKVADQMSATFIDEGEENTMPLDRRVKVIPSLGNNDVYPHNLFAPGPTLQTREMFKIWRDFIPPEQMHTFDRGVYFLREVVPGRLAVLSINTLYLFNSNPLCDNCNGRKQPGYKLFEWLGIVLKELRKRGMKVWLTGHVPPVPKNLHFSCHAKMSVWLHEYRDIIVGSLYGHMNIDHFVPLDSVKSWRTIRKRLEEMGLGDEARALAVEEGDEEDDIELYEQLGLLDDDFEVERVSKRYESAPSGKVSYLENVRDTLYTKLKGARKSGVNGERYSIAHVTASVIPTFNPGLRVWEYNVSAIYGSEEVKSAEFESWDSFFERVEAELNESDRVADMLEKTDLDDSVRIEYETPSKDRTIPPILPVGTPPGPAYVAQLFSPERYTQFYIDLDSAAADPDWKFRYELQYSTDDEHYEMESLLVQDWLDLARKMAKAGRVKGGEVEGGVEVRKKAERLWNKYVDRAFIGTGYQDMSFARD